MTSSRWMEWAELARGSPLVLDALLRMSVLALAPLEREAAPVGEVL